MTLDPEMLLAGPRGRRLCLEYAVACTQVAGTRGLGAHDTAERDASHDGDELRRAVLLVAYALDPGRGTSRVMLTARVDGTDHDVAGPDVDEHHVTPEPTPADVARLLDDVPLAPLDPTTLMDALGAAIDHARYWQEPDGEDVLAASPELHDALTRVAAHVARSAGAAWWSTPLDRTAQWTVTPEGVPWSPPVRQPVADELARWHAQTVAEEATAGRDRPRDPRASWSGTWWSMPPAELTRSTRALGGLGPVGLWLVEDAYGWGRATTRPLATPGVATVYEVNGPEAWADLCRRYPLEVTAARRHDWYRATGVDTRWCVPDWSAAAADLDAVHLTVAGYLATAGRAVVVGDGLSTVLAGWDPDQTCWLVDVPEPGPGEERWARDDDGVWTRRP